MGQSPARKEGKMKILLGIIVLLFSTQVAFAGTNCNATCRAHKAGVSKKLRAYKGPMICLQFKQDRRGSVRMTLYTRTGLVVGTWQNVKGTRDQMCVPASLVKSASAMIVCGCKTLRNPAGRWQKVNLTIPAERRALVRGKVLPLCRRN